MSILNVLIADEFALIGSDSDGVTPEGCHFQVSKMAVLPHLNAVFAVLGNSVFFEHAFSIIHGKTLDLEGLLSEIPAILDQVTEDPRCAHMIGKKQEFALVGWSNRSQRPIARAFKLDAQRHFLAAYQRYRSEIHSALRDGVISIDDVATWQPEIERR